MNIANEFIIGLGGGSCRHVSVVTSDSSITLILMVCSAEVWSLYHRIKYTVDLGVGSEI